MSDDLVKRLRQNAKRKIPLWMQEVSDLYFLLTLLWWGFIILVYVALTGGKDE